MKKILLSLFVLIYNFSYSQINLNNGLVGYYPFSGNANDVSGHGNNGVVNNATLTNDRYGNPNSAYLFDGSTSFIQIPNSNSFQFGSNISLVAVVKPTGFYSGKCHGNSIIFKGYGDPDPSLSILRFEDGQYLNYNNCSMPVDPQHQNFYGQYTYGAPGYTPYIVANQWYCVVYTYDGNVAKLYIDGQLKVSYNITGLNFNNSEDIFLGMANQPGFPYWFKGVFDEVRIYNRAINAQEVTSLCGCVNTSINTQPHDTAVCEGASVKFDISAVNTSAYQWQINEGSGWVNLIDNNNYSGSNAQTLNIKTTNASMNGVKYHVIVSNCNTIISADVTLTVNPVLSPSITISPSKNNVCGPTSITFTAKGVNAGLNPTYQWFKNNNPVGPVTSTYTDNNINDNDVIYCTITTSAPCPVTAKSNSVNMVVYPVVENIRYPTINYTSSNPIKLNARTFQGAQYLWMPSLGLDNNSVSDPNFSFKTSVEYLIHITQTTGCKNVDTLLVKVYSKVDILVPTGFTPNNDGRNDKAFPTLLGIKTLLYFKIFNRWGNLIFESNEATRNDGWNGDYKGEKQQIGSYVWIAEGLDFDGNSIKRSGSLNLIR